jgi:peptide chain release factor 2
LTGARRPSGGIFDLDSKHERLTEVVRELEEPEVWNNPERVLKRSYIPLIT